MKVMSDEEPDPAQGRDPSNRVQSKLAPQHSRCAEVRDIGFEEFCFPGVFVVLL